MSNNKNLFALLGNDVSDDESDFVPVPKEIVKKTTSSKKVDAPPPSADKSRAKKNGKPAASGNEAGAKLKNTNRDSEGPKSTARKSAKSHKTDRQNKTGKTATPKSEKAKLGDEAISQIQGEEDAEEELAEEEEVEAAPAVKSYEDFLKESQQAALNIAKPKRAANSGSDKWTNNEVLTKEKEEFFSATASKKTKSKAKKEKVILDVDAVFADSVAPTRERAPARGGHSKRGGSSRGASRGGAKKGAVQTSKSNVEFPSLA